MSVLIVIFVILYVVLSTTEWAIHKYIMHTKVTSLGSFIESTGTNHLIHHVAVRPDMSIDKNVDDYHKLGEAENTCFFWPEIISTTIPLVLFSVVLARVMKVKTWIPITMTLILMAYTVSMWNNLHPAIHGRSGYALGAPLAFKEGTLAYNMLVNSRLGHFLRENHILHHNIKKPYKTNFNVTAPLADYLYGTHSSYLT